MMAGTQEYFCVILPVGNVWPKEARVSNDGLWVHKAYLAASPCPCWVLLMGVASKERWIWLGLLLVLSACQQG